MRFVLGDWAVDPASNGLSRGDERRQIEPRAMQVLVALCELPGRVFSAEQLLQQCWPEQPLGDNPVHKTVAQLRRALDDSATEPRYIETLRKRGYRVLAPVVSSDGPTPQAREGSWRGGSPFRGLQAFDAAHAEVFFGRDGALQALLQSVLAQWRERRAFTLLLGPSGSGKTSLVQAGLFPALQGLSSAGLDLGDIGQHAPLAALAAALLDWEVDGQGLFPGASADSLARSLAQTPQAVLAEIAAARQGRDAALLLFVDRLEALFVAPHLDAGCVGDFLCAVQTLADSGDVIVVAACRNDFYPRLSEHALLMRDKQRGAHFDLGPPSRAEIAQMIRLPARAAGLSFGIDPTTRARLDDQLCDDAANSPDALPLLQYTLEELYRLRGPHGELSFAAYRELGGLEGAIGLRAEAVIKSLLPIQQQALPQVLALQVSLSADEARATSRRALWDELGGAAERELVQALVDARLLVSDLIEQRAGFRVAHEAILRRWPRVTEWIAEHQQALQLRSRLRQQVARWQAEGQAAEYLLPKGKQLADALALLGRSEFAISAAEHDYVQASRRRAARGERLRLAAVLGLALLTLLSGALAWRADRAEQLARQRSAQSDDLLGYMLGEFADKLRPIGRLELLDGVGAKAIAHLGADAATDLHGRLQRAKALTVLGEVAVSKRELDAALQPLQAARRLLAADAPAPELAADWRKAQGTAAFWLGHVHFTQRQFVPARAAMEEYRRFSEAWLAQEPDGFEPLVELSYAQNSLGTVMLDIGDLAGASRQFRDSLALKQRALRLRPQDLALKAQWADSQTWLGTSLLWQGEFGAARSHFADSLQAIAEARAAAPRDLEWRYREAMAHSWLGTAWQALGEPARARGALRTAVTLLQDLLEQEPKNRLWRSRLARAEILLAELAPPGSQTQRMRELVDELQALEAGASPAAMLRRLPLRAQAARALSRHLPADRQSPLRPLLPALALAIERQPDDLRLQVENAGLRLALAALPDAADAPAQCEIVRTGLDKLNHLLRVHFEITEYWVQAYSCLGRAADVRREQQWLDARRASPP